MTKPILFGLVGGGWRAEFFMFIAQSDVPEQFEIAGCVARTDATRARMKATWIFGFSMSLMHCLINILFLLSRRCRGLRLHRFSSS